MKVGFYGGCANNMYVFAKLADRNGWDVRFIRDRGDRYPFSQPVWEDVACTLAYEDLFGASRWSWNQWTSWEAQRGWRPLRIPLYADAWLVAEPGRVVVLHPDSLYTAVRQLPLAGRTGRGDPDVHPKME